MPRVCASEETARPSSTFLNFSYDALTENPIYWKPVGALLTIGVVTPTVHRTARCACIARGSARATNRLKVNFFIIYGFLKQIPEEKLEDIGWLIAVQSYDIARKQTILINKYNRKK